MASKLCLRDSWILGIDNLDADHREIVRLFNRLVDGEQGGPMSQGRPGDHSDGLLDRLEALIDHLRRHFAVEEALLDEMGYPDAPAHKREHALQMAELVDLHRQLTITKFPRVDDQSLDALKDWFFAHVVDEDRYFARYYRQHAGRSSERSRADAVHRNRPVVHHGASAPQRPACHGRMG